MNNNELYHYGVKGMKWGVRRYQNKDGSLTPAGKQRYDNVSNDRLQNVVLSKRGETVELHKDPKPVTAKFLAKIIPGLKKEQNKYDDYSIKDKEGKKVGTISTYKESDNSLNIVWIGINGKSEGNGYGQSAMRTIIDHAVQSGFKQMTLEVPTTSPNARHIYEKLGFKETGEKMLGDEDDFWGGLTKMKLKL